MLWENDSFAMFQLETTNNCRANIIWPIVGISLQSPHAFDVEGDPRGSVLRQIFLLANSVSRANAN